ncbi:hypothetical protein NEFER03_0554 [Nematocida sp. LUAm3]|nr:hypothetical protein NEFER03_0554 [Nematocida sp. LUAm3]KAI5175521.1 hypothetical protein NEFER02_1427 [Nematocida sp. LUAm2]KAI5178449.1 hypothetical protein NEFER01_1596 [Nematocida sp. LUAm1]
MSKRPEETQTQQTIQQNVSSGIHQENESQTLIPGLYCIETKEIPITQKKEDPLESVYFTTDFWKALAHKDAAYTHFVSIAPLVAISPFIAKNDPYLVRVLMIIFSIYYTISLLFIKSIISWWFYLQLIRKKHGKSSLDQIYTKTHAIMHTGMIIVVMLGLLVISGRIGVGDREIQNILSDSSTNLLVEPPTLPLIPFVTYPLHSQKASIFLYLIITISSSLLLLSNKVNYKSSEIIRKHQYKWRILLILLSILTVSLERALTVFLKNNSFSSFLSTLKVFVLFFIFYLPVVIGKEIKKGVLLIPKDIKEKVKTEESVEIWMNIFYTALILTVSLLMLIEWIL